MTEPDLENIARFISKGTLVDKIILFNEDGEFILSTFGSFINKCPDEKYLEKLKKTLIPYQTGEIDPFKYEIKFEMDEEEVKEGTNKKDFANEVYRDFNYELLEIQYDVPVEEKKKNNEIPEWDFSEDIEEYSDVPF